MAGMSLLERTHLKRQAEMIINSWARSGQHILGVHRAMFIVSNGDISLHGLKKRPLQTKIA
jgi:hypothetical protein